MPSEESPSGAIWSGYLTKDWSGQLSGQIAAGVAGIGGSVGTGGASVNGGIGTNGGLGGAVTLEGCYTV
ncbi:MAG: hypothetical protein ABSH20_22350 [Tepidisphaeraceae bacterium]